MAFLSFLHKPRNELESGGRTGAPYLASAEEPERSCPNCRKSYPVSLLWERQMTCTCGYHFRMHARQRIGMLTDRNTFSELFAHVMSHDPLGFPGYIEKLDVVRSANKESEAVICGTAKIEKQKCCLFVMEPNFMMGSMGSGVGEKITLLFEYAMENRLPVVGFTVSGGARMQEGLVSLMQMAKTSAAVKRHSDAGFLYITVLTDPTTGGVTASFAMEGDIILAEPGATIGFAGARVIEQTTKKALPKGFQTAEFMLRHGFVDAVVPRDQQRMVISELLKIHAGGK